MNWSNFIKDLIASGMTQAAIGKEIGLSQPSIVDLLNGKTKSVKWDVGQAIIKLHKKHCK